MFEKVSGFSNSIILATIVILVLCGFIILNLVFFYFKRKKQLDRENLLKVQFQQTILQAQLEIQEQTFKNISQEIHDNIGQVLSLAKLNINTMNPDKNDELHEKIQTSGQLVSKAIQDLRDLSKSLNTDFVNEMGLAKLIEYEAGLIRKAGVYEVHLDIKGAYGKLSPQHELILFRIFQEVVNNIIKHAGASEINIRLCCDALFTLHISDNGHGFDTMQQSPIGAPFSGLGIRNMKNRAALIGATFQVESEIGKGTAVHITLPLPAQPVQAIR